MWPRLSAGEQETLEALILRLIADKRWEAAHGFTLTDEITVTIAAHAAVVILGLDYEAYRHVSSILVHASTIVVDGQQHLPGGLVFDGVMPIDGRTDYRGPVVLAWDAVERDARQPAWGHNVVFHEFAHVLDMIDGVIDGTPPLAPADRDRWVEVCTAEMAAVSERGDPDELLRDYSATNPAEFFAVATEVFFCRPIELRAAKPALYDVLAGFYRQRPADWPDL
jgi:MtfA peptidase